MRHLLFLLMCDSILIKGNINQPRCGLITSITSYLKCLQCAINPRLHSLSASLSDQGLFLWFVQNGQCFKARMNPQSNRPGNLKGVAGFKNQAEL